MMIHPSYKEMIDAVNQEREDDTVPVVSRRSSLVMATATPARQRTAGGKPPVEEYHEGEKPLSIAVDEVFEGAVKILPEETN